jgi:hypothetical protein
VKALYRACVGADWVSPSEFWRLAPGEVWWLIDAHTPRNHNRLDGLREMIAEAKAKERHGASSR